MPTIITAGAISANGYGFLASERANYIEDVFSTWLYTGNGSSQTISNGIDLANRGGLVWMKGRSGATDHALYDSARGSTFDLVSNTTAAQTTQAQGLTGFLTNGFSIGSLAKINTNAATYTSWTFRKQAKFFDVVTYTGNGINGTAISHSLGSVPGCIIIKRTNGTGDWFVHHRSYNGGVNPDQYTTYLNSTAAVAGPGIYSQYQAPTSGAFYPTGGANSNGATYVAYLFAHDAGGFGATGADNVISCGSFTTDGSGNATVTLGYEPQFLLTKSSTTAGTNWNINDVMRGMFVGSDPNTLFPNLNNAETSSSARLSPTATGFIASGGFVPSSTYIYIAIRRGPMRTPTSGTSVFSPIASSAATGTKLTTNFPVDLQIYSLRTGTTNKGNTVDRLRGVSSSSTESGAQLITNSTGIETTNLSPTRFWDNTGFQMPTNYGGTSTVFWNFRRASKCFEMVGYTGSGVNRTVSHNLGVVPELMIVKRRSTTVAAWQVYSAALANTEYLVLDTTAGKASGTTRWNSTTPTSSVFTVGTDATVNASTATYIAYLFASLAGVSKVGTYTGTGATQQIDCGFTGGARFVLIKRIDTTGDWYVWDSARGIVAGNDPYLLLNSTAAEVTNTDYIDAYSAGFEISSTAPAGVNANSGTFIYLAIA